VKERAEKIDFLGIEKTYKKETSKSKFLAHLKKSSLAHWEMPQICV
jgi:hypothetical protein